MRHSFGTFLALLAAISLASLSQRARAEGHNSQATLGSQGREVRVAECPVGEVLAGVAGRVGAAIDQIQILCAPLLANGGYGTPHPFRDRYGGFGGADTQPVACRGNLRIAAAGVALDSTNTWVAETWMRCVDQNGNLAQTLHFGGGSNMRTTCTNIIVSFCNDRVGATAEYSCPDEYFTGIRVRFDTGVRGLGYLCDRRSPPAAAAPAPKPIKHSGKPRVNTQPAPATVSVPRPVPQDAVAVKLDVDVYDSPGGDGRKTAELGAGTAGVVLLAQCEEDWCHVRWPGHEGWVYSGKDYNSLGR